MATIRHGSDMEGLGRLRAEWNGCLLERVIAPCYLRLLEESARCERWWCESGVVVC